MKKVWHKRRVFLKRIKAFKTMLNIFLEEVVKDSRVSVNGLNDVIRKPRVVNMMIFLRVTK